MATSVGDERKDWELKKETELRLEVDESQQVVIRVSEGASGGRVESLCLLHATSRLVVLVPLQSHAVAGNALLLCGPARVRVNDPRPVPLVNAVNTCTQSPPPPITSLPHPSPLFLGPISWTQAQLKCLVRSWPEGKSTSSSVGQK